MALKPTNHIRIKPIPICDRRSVTVRLYARPSTKAIVKKPANLALSHKVSRPPQPRNLPIKQIPATIGGIPVNHKILNINALKGKGKGRVLVIVGNGPSHKMADLPRLKNHPLIDIMSINKPDDRLWPTTYWFFCDNSQLRRHQHLWESYKGIILNTPSIREQKENTYKIKSIGNIGFSLDMVTGLYIGRSSVYAGMQLAVWMEYDHTYIFGCDMAAVDGKLYAWGTNPDVKDSERLKRFIGEAKSYEYAGQHLPASTRARFTFCSEFNQWPFIQKFNQLDHISAIDKILAYANI